MRITEPIGSVFLFIASGGNDDETSNALFYLWVPALAVGWVTGWVVGLGEMLLVAYVWAEEGNCL
jgi:hypothetical protein